MPRERRFVFGEVAESYHRSRPAYPQALIDDVVAWAGGAGKRVLDVGAGTGKATLALADAGLEVVALEPSPEMAAVLRRETGRRDDVQVVEVGLEDWEPRVVTFDLVCSAQAWHWVTPGLRSQRAIEALHPGGGLAVFWNFAAPADDDLRRVMERIYTAHEPEVGILMPGAVDKAPEWLGDTIDELERSPEFDSIEVREYGWNDAATTRRYLDLLDTYTDHRMLEAGARDRLFRDLADVINEAGGTVAMPTTSRLVLARRTLSGQ